MDDLITGFQLPDGQRWARPVGIAIGLMVRCISLARVIAMAYFACGGRAERNAFIRAKAHLAHEKTPSGKLGVKSIYVLLLR